MRRVCTSNCPLRTQSIVSPKELLPGLFLGRTEGDSSTLLLIVIIWFKVNAGGKWTLNYTRKRRNKNWDKSSTPGASRSADSSNQVISLRSVIYTRRVYKSLLFWCRQIEADKKLCLGHHVNCKLNFISFVFLQSSRNKPNYWSRPSFYNESFLELNCHIFPEVSTNTKSICRAGEHMVRV